MGAGRSVFTNFGKESNYTILLLGQTGSGKTSLLNLIANIYRIRRIRFEDDEVLATQELQAFGQGFVTDLSVENALEDSMASKTSDARVYQLELAENWFLTIMDTPGFGDSRGIEVDQEHVKRIMGCLKEKIQSINCVMVVVNGREARMTATMTYVLSQLTVVMPKAVMEHIAVVFTNTETKRKLNFNIESFKDIGLPVPKYECLENPFGAVQKATAAYPEGADIPDDEREELTEDIRKSLKALEKVGWMVHDLKPIPSIRFAELNTKREKMEALLANNLELIVEHQRLVADLNLHRKKIASSGTLNPLEREFVRWYISRDMFSWSKYVCHSAGCHCNCVTSEVFSPFASLWCAFNENTACTHCGHIYRNHRVSRDGWKSTTVTEKVDVGNTVGEAEERLQEQIANATRQKQALAQELDAALDEYAKLGLRNAYMHLLRSQKAVLQERLQTTPDDETLKRLLDTIKKSLTEVEEAAESTCCICHERAANTVLSCGHKTFCEYCAQQVGTCPLCRAHVTSRMPASITAAS